MVEPRQLDPLILGRRLRHYRNEAGLTLDQLGRQVGKPAPYLSLLENGKKEPRVTLVMDLASALEVDVSDLLELTPPSRRDALELALIRSQESSLFESLELPAVKPNAKMSTETLTHIVGLHDALRDKSGLDSAGSEDVRRANGAVHAYLADHDGYLESVEAVAREALAASGYAGEGPFSSRNLLDLVADSGFDLTPIDDMPLFARSIIDTEHRRIYIAQRNELRTRQARKAVLQTLAGSLLEQETDPDLDTFLRQRMETAYFAGAVLVPEEAVVGRLRTSREQHDIDVEDVKELYYVSYEMAAWRTVNLLTRHLGIDCHLLVSDQMGTIVKGYANDGRPSVYAAGGEQWPHSAQSTASSPTTSTPTPLGAPSSAPHTLKRVGIRPTPPPWESSSPMPAGSEDATPRTGKSHTVPIPPAVGIHRSTQSIDGRTR